MLENELIIKEPRLSLFRRIMVSVAFGLFFLLCIFIYDLSLNLALTTGDRIQIISYIISVFLALILFMAPLICRHVIHLKFKELKIRHSYELGLWTYHEKWQDLEGFDYISVFKIGQTYQVNLWYDDKSILNLFVMENFEEAMTKAYEISEKLTIKLLDASEKGNHRWVDKNSM